MHAKTAMTTIDHQPGATEVPYDGIDANCDGFSDYDADSSYKKAQHIQVRM